ncbi:MAG: hypothetical protein HC896_11785 [Bacteroidales bacterium]|nr:hypothetical protein [Bacteroidales bacterium]
MKAKFLNGFSGNYVKRESDYANGMALLDDRLIEEAESLEFGDGFNAFDENFLNEN